MADLEIRDSNGRVQFSSENIGIPLRVSKEIPIPNSFTDLGRNGIREVVVNIDFDPRKGILAIAPSLNQKASIMVAGLPVNGTIPVRVMAHSPNTHVSGYLVVLEYSRTGAAPAGSGFGVQTFDQFGRVVYDSMYGNRTVRIFARGQSVPHNPRRRRFYILPYSYRRVVATPNGQFTRARAYVETVVNVNGSDTFGEVLRDTIDNSVLRPLTFNTNATPVIVGDYVP